MMLSEESVEFDLAFCMNFMDEKYMEQIADIHDVIIILTRPYIPYVNNTLSKSGVMIMETGNSVYDLDSYLKKYFELDSPCN